MRAAKPCAHLVAQCQTTASAPARRWWLGGAGVPVGHAASASTLVASVRELVTCRFTLQHLRMRTLSRAHGHDFHMSKADGTTGETKTQRRWYEELESAVESQQAECVMASGTVKWFRSEKVIHHLTASERRGEHRAAIKFRVYPTQDH